MHRRVAQEELQPFDIQVRPSIRGPSLTGFNERMAESAFQWQDDTRNFIKRADIQNFFDFLEAKHFQRDPKEVVDAMVSIVPADAGLFRNVVSKPDEDFVKTNQREAWEKRMLIRKREREIQGRVNQEGCFNLPPLRRRRHLVLNRSLSELR